MGNLWKYILDRLSEASTWRGIVMALTAIGIQISPELMTQIITVGVGLVGLIGMLTKDPGTEGSK